MTALISEFSAEDLADAVLDRHDGAGRTIEIRAFGQRMDLAVPRFSFLWADSLWRLEKIYQPALATQTLDKTGVAIDIGAGFGAFAIPFAAAFPGWQVFCFEPDPATFAALAQNIATQGLSNVVALPFAVGADPHDMPENPDLVRATLLEIASGRLDLVPQLQAMLHERVYSRHNENLGYMERGSGASLDFSNISFATIPAKLLAVLDPRLLKLLAPNAEASILGDLKTCELDHIIGEAWSHVPSELINGKTAGLRQTWLPLAGTPLLGLRRVIETLEPGLDVVVAMYNSRNFIVDCVNGILNGTSGEVRALVVDDGSTDDSAAVVRAHFGNDPRVVLLQKPNGGCASARNFGRMHSKATHIAFVDADDIPGPELFAGLLDLSRHTGAEIVQGGFDLLFDDGEDGLRREASYEASDDAVKYAHRHAFGRGTCHLLESRFLIQGQPSIWRRVYRRDFLDNRKIWFPEHIRAFDDQIFQMLTLQSVFNVPVLDGVSYGYRQHGGQDIRSNDERNFYSLEMFRLLLKRGTADGWSDFYPMLRSFINTVNWIFPNLRPELRPAFIKGAAELWVYARKTLGEAVFAELPTSAFLPLDFEYHVSILEERLKGFAPSYAWAYLDSFEMHVPMVKSLRK
jgi:glycosyltransferase involved in cell wall biosynthesis